MPPYDPYDDPYDDPYADPPSNAPLMARQNSGSGGANTLDDDTLDFAIMEFLMNSDSNDIKRIWRGYGFSDVTPLWGDKASVPTFQMDKRVIARWPEFQEAMASCEADWYYLSGHHGRQFSDDFDADDKWGHVANQKEVGFFNEPYHTGPWEKASASDPDKGRTDNDVYMTTSREGGGCEGLGPEDNPLYQSVHDSCRGVLLIGCNSLIYRHPRIMYNKYFPSAVVIGLVTGEGNSIAKVKRLNTKYGRSFWLDPRSVDPAEIAAYLNPNPGLVDMMGVMCDGTLYVRFDGKDMTFAHDERVELSELA
jgi:hypothetical protein